MNNKQTTFAGLITALATLGAAWGFGFDPKIVSTVSVVGTALIGLFAADASNNGQ